jgi:hypothetical protein
MNHYDCTERDGTYIALFCVCSVSLPTLSRPGVTACIASFAYFTNPDYRLIRMTSPQINPD